MRGGRRVTVREFGGQFRRRRGRRARTWGGGSLRCVSADVHVLPTDGTRMGEGERRFGGRSLVNVWPVAKHTVRDARSFVVSWGAPCREAFTLAQSYPALSSRASDTRPVPRSPGTGSVGVQERATLRSGRASGGRGDEPAGGKRSWDTHREWRGARGGNEEDELNSFLKLMSFLKAFVLFLGSVFQLRTVPFYHRCLSFA